MANHIAYVNLCLARHFIGSIKKADRTIPGKAYIYEAMDKTMILGDTTANHELFSEDANHLFVRCGDARALAKVMLALEQDNNACERVRA